MSNKLPKNKKNNTDAKNKPTGDTMKTFFSFNPIGNKVFSLYEDSKKKEATVTRHAVNDVISLTIILLVLTVFSFTEQIFSLIMASIIVCIIEIAISCWNIYKGKNKKIWITCIVISAIFMIINIILLI